MKRYQKTMLKDFEILLPYILLLGILVLLAISVSLLQDFTKIYQITRHTKINIMRNFRQNSELFQNMRRKYFYKNPYVCE